MRKSEGRRPLGVKTLLFSLSIFSIVVLWSNVPRIASSAGAGDNGGESAGELVLDEPPSSYSAEALDRYLELVADLSTRVESHAPLSSQPVGGSALDREWESYSVGEEFVKSFLTMAPGRPPEQLYRCVDLNPGDTYIVPPARERIAMVFDYYARALSECRARKAEARRRAAASSGRSSSSVRPIVMTDEALQELVWVAEAG